MYTQFSNVANRTVCGANYMYYAQPTLHPDRILREHDFIYLLNGEWKIGQEDRVYTMHPGDVLLLSAGLHHYPAEACAEQSRTMFIHVLGEESDRILAEDGPLGEGVSLPPLIRTGGHGEVEALFRKIVLADAENDRVRAAAYFSVLLYELRAVQDLQQDPLAERIRGLILSSGGIPGNEDIADALHVSVKTAERVFKATFGVSIHQYILQIRIRQAQEILLHDPSMTLAALARNLGFYDEYHLSRQFKRICGVSPLQYKKQISR